MKRVTFALKRTFLLLALAVIVVSFAVAQSGKAYPSRSVEFVVPSGAGGGQDTLVRLMQPFMEKELGVSIRVSNVSGGAHVKGIVYSYSAPADGYIVHCESPSGLIADVFKKMPFKFYEEFVPVARIQQDIGILWAGGKGRFKTAQEMIAFAKKNPGKVTVAIASPGGVDDAGVGTFANLAGIELAMVPVESGGERMASVIANHIDMMYEEASAVGDMVKSGNLIPLVVFRDERINSPDLKNAVSAGELGIMGMGSLGTWRGFAVKKGTPKEIVDRLESAMKKFYDSADYQKWAKENSLDLNPGWMGQAEFGKLWKETIDTYSVVFKKLGRL